MGVDLRAVKKQFADLVENIQPVAVSQFVVWLDEKVSEFKVNGQMRLDIELDAPAWIRKYSMSMLAAGLTPTTVDRTRPKITPKRPAPVFNSARKSTTTTMNNASTNRRFNRLPKIADVLNQSDTDDDVVVTTQATIQAGAVRDAVLGAPAATITSRPSVSLLNNRPVSSKPKTSRSSPLTLTAVTAKLKQDRPEEPSQKSLKLEEVDTESFNEASYVDKHDVADTGCSEVDRFRSATVKTEPQDSTGDQQPPNHALGAFVVGDAPCLSDPHDDDLDMSVEDGAAYLYPTAIRDLDASEYVAINTNSTENSRVGEEISTDLSNSGDYDGDGLESSYDDPADYMELINQSGSDKPHPGTSSESDAFPVLVKPSQFCNKPLISEDDYRRRQSELKRMSRIRMSPDRKAVIRARDTERQRIRRQNMSGDEKVELRRRNAERTRMKRAMRKILSSGGYFPMMASSIKGTEYKPALDLKLLDAGMVSTNEQNDFSGMLGRSILTGIQAGAVLPPYAGISTKDPIAGYVGMSNVMGYPISLLAAGHTSGTAMSSSSFFNVSLPPSPMLNNKDFSTPHTPAYPGDYSSEDTGSSARLDPHTVPVSYGAQSGVYQHMIDPCVTASGSVEYGGPFREFPRQFIANDLQPQPPTAHPVNTSGLNACDVAKRRTDAEFPHI